MITDEVLNEYTEMMDNAFSGKNGNYKVSYGTDGSKNILDAFKELQDRRQSDLRVATKFLTNSYYRQIEHIESEFDETREAVTDLIETMVLDNKPDYADKLSHAAEEIVDLQSTCETMLAILGFDKQQRREIRKRVIAKNAARHYYEEDKEK